MRIFSNPRRSMQRVGFLKHLVWQASMFTTSNVSKLGNELTNAVSRKVRIELTEQLKDYIANALTSPPYHQLRQAIQERCSEESLRIEMELQDIYLADARIPSRRGKLVSDDWKRYPYLAVYLSMLQSGTFSLTVRGKAFLSLVSDDEKMAFKSTDAIFEENRNNPMILTLPQKILLIFSFIEADADILRKVYHRIINLHRSFSDKEIGDFFPDIYRSIAKEHRTKVRSGDDLLRIQKLLDTASKIESVTKNPSPGGKNAREHATSVRLEPFVDFGLLLKPEPYAYYYEATESTSLFFNKLIGTDNVDEFLHQSFFSCTNIALNLQKEKQTTRDKILPVTSRAYDCLKSPLGYAPIFEVCLLAGIYSLVETDVYFEISDVLSCLKMLQKEEPKLVRFNVDRWGKLNFIKFTDDITNR